MKNKFFAAMAWAVLAITGMTGCGGGGSGDLPPVTIYAVASNSKVGVERQLRTLEENGIRVRSYKCQAGEGPLIPSYFPGVGTTGEPTAFLLVSTDAPTTGVLDAVQERVKRGDISSPLSGFIYFPTENPSTVLQLYEKSFDCSLLGVPPTILHVAASV
jgi:predicted small lipoprotein YifL